MRQAATPQQALPLFHINVKLVAGTSLPARGRVAAAAAARASQHHSVLAKERGSLERALALGLLMPGPSRHTAGVGEGSLCGVCMGIECEWYAP